VRTLGGWSSLSVGRLGTVAWPPRKQRGALATLAVQAALAHWRPSMLVGLPVGPILAGRSAAVEEERLAINEELAEAQLVLDEPQRAVRLLHERTCICIRSENVHTHF
jgi:Bacterial transcriptional activator domain